MKHQVCVTPAAHPGFNQGGADCPGHLEPDGARGKFLINMYPLNAF